MGRKNVVVTVIDTMGAHPACHYGHQVGDTFDFARDRGQLCPMAAHVLFPYVDILRYGGTIPTGADGDIRVCCPDADTCNVFRLDVQDEDAC